MKWLLFLPIMVVQYAFGQIDDHTSILKVIHTEVEYEKSVIEGSGKKMEDVKTIPGIKIELKYASKRNFMHKRLYSHTNTTYARHELVQSLKLVQLELLKKGLSIKIWDAYRPYSITKLMWDEIQDDRYVANPKNGSGHNRGTAIDLTLINIYNGIELDMGTGFDNFTDTAHADFTNLPLKIIQNRKLLTDLMVQYGFKNLSTEWWHFYLPNSDQYDVLDLTFSALKRLTGSSVTR